MNRRQFLAGFSAAAAGGGMGMRGAPAGRRGVEADCGCAPMLAPAPAGNWPAPRIKVTNLKAIGVTLTGESDRPYVFVKIETDQGVVGWGEATLEGKASAAMAAVNDFRDFIVGQDPMKVEHHWQSMYVHTFYRAGPVLGSAIAGIDQALWDIRGKVLGMPVYKLLGGPVDARGVRGYYHANPRTKEEFAQLRATAKQTGVTCLKSGIPGYYEWIETNRTIRRAVESLERLREGLGEEIDIAIDFHAKTSPSVATIICKEVEPLNLLFIEEPCPPENVKAMARIARRTTTPIATGERLIASYGCRELIEMGVVDILQTDINHVGGISALRKVAAMAEASGISMAPHACEGPIGATATLHVDSAMPNFVVQEICSGVEPGEKEKIWAEWFGFPAMRMVNGFFPLPEKPGLGFELSEAALARFPFGGTRPMARVFHADGSVAEW
ncbi:MAG TPA: galactonate dehydratase [Bryobacterales bacterium]|nr:galactonate dehydratase [Bryobacterales bacterium]